MLPQSLPEPATSIALLVTGFGAGAAALAKAAHLVQQIRAGGHASGPGAGPGTTPSPGDGQMADLERAMDLLTRELRDFLAEQRRLDEVRAKHWENLLTVLLERLRREIDEDARDRRA